MWHGHSELLHVVGDVRTCSRSRSACTCCAWTRGTPQGWASVSPWPAAGWWWERPWRSCRRGGSRHPGWAAPAPRSPGRPPCWWGVPPRDTGRWPRWHARRNRRASSHDTEGGPRVGARRRAGSWRAGHALTMADYTGPARNKREKLDLDERISQDHLWGMWNKKVLDST